MQLSEKELKSLLAEAYERGYRGFLEGKDECVSSMLASFRLVEPSDSYCSITVSSPQANALDPYYLYSSMTFPPQQNSGRNEIV